MRFLTVFVGLALFFAFFAPFIAEAGQRHAFRSTPYPLPRFVSLSAHVVFVRAGPGTRYPVKWVYQKKMLPLEVILEFEAWRKIKDHEGQAGWVHQSLLSGKRTALVQSVDHVALRRRPRGDSRHTALVEPYVVGRLQECREAWCLFEAQGYKGWMQRKYIWGIYENEIFD